MRTLFSIVAAVIRAMSARVYQWVRVNGRWLLRLLPGASPPTGMADVPLFPDQATGDPVASLKRAAGRLSQAHPLEPADIVGLAENEVRWLRGLTKRQLCILMAKSEAVLEAHLSGRFKSSDLPSLDVTRPPILLGTPREVAARSALLSPREDLLVADADEGHRY